MILGRRSLAALGFVAVALITAPGEAVAEIPADVVARIHAVAADFRARGEQRQRTPLIPPNPILARVLAENDRRNQKVGWIRNPCLTHLKRAMMINLLRHRRRKYRKS